MKKVFIIHGWGFNPKMNWYPWLKKELEKKGFLVEVPEMPNTKKPEIKAWVYYLRKIVKNPNENTYFIGHSIGCQTILRYLQNVKGKVGGVVLVAGWVNLSGLETQEEKEIAKPWLEKSIDFDRIKNKAKNFVAIYSDTDPYVSLSDVEIFKRRLSAKAVLERGKGHFTEDDGVKSLPSVLEELLGMAK